MCEREDELVPQRDAGGAYRGSRPSWSVGPPSKVPSGASDAVELVKAEQAAEQQRAS